MKSIEVLIIHYNTPNLTAAAVRSLWKQTPDAHVTIFDNSDNLPWTGKSSRLTYIDNTQGQIVNWEEWLATFPDKYPCPENNYGSAKHCYSVEVCMDLFPRGFILADSDILFKQDITPLWDERFAWVGHANMGYKYRGFMVPRVEPFLCFINTPLLARYGIRYFNPDKMWKLRKDGPYAFYDTGAWFLEACNNNELPGKEIDIWEYILHLCNGSWKQVQPREWLLKHRDLWQ